jgi:hypothetical protein
VILAVFKVVFQELIHSDWMNKIEEEEEEKEGNPKDYYLKENYGFFIQNPYDIDDEEYLKEYQRFKVVNDDKVTKQR